MIICLEGIDACGKATQAQRMAEKIRGTLMSFPDYTTPTGFLIKKNLQGWAAADDPEVNALVLQALMTINRMERASFLNRYLHLHADDIVLDRYWPSGLVYGTADGLDYDWLIAIHEALPQAHHYVLLDIDPELSAQRRPDRRDRYERQAGLMQEAAQRYRDLWAEMQQTHKSQWHVVDGNGTVDEVEERIWAKLKDPT